MPNVVIDPVTRIEGHLRITCTVEDGKVTDAWNTCTMFRGFEIFMRDREPRSAWHFASRICGVCPTPHGQSSVTATEKAMGIDEIPDNARLVRNMMQSAMIGYDHILWFYHLNALDYVNPVNALKAKPKTQPLKSLQATLKGVVDSGQLSIFTNGYWDHPAYKLPPDLDLELVGHYLQALEAQQIANEATAFLGGKFPMIMNFAPGGVTELPSLEEILYYKSQMQRVKDFTDNVMVPDLLTIAPYYLDHATFGQGVRNYLSWGILDEKSQQTKDRLLPSGAIYDGKITDVQDVTPDDVKMFTKYSWYKDSLGAGKHPLDSGQADIEFTKLPEATGKVEGKYDWTQAARYGKDNRPMEVGPLADMLIAYGSGMPEAKKLVDDTLAAIGQAGKPDVLMSALGRIAARVLRAKINTDNALRWADELLENIKNGDTKVVNAKEVPDTGEGAGPITAPRGALCHYMRLQGGKIESYAAVPASNWNLSPRDDKGVRGPTEEALIGTPVSDPEKPLEILRVVHTFDP